MAGAYHKKGKADYTAKRCASCRCWPCWRDKGFNPARCATCFSAVCPSGPAVDACSNRLTAAIASGEVVRVGEV